MQLAGVVGTPGGVGGGALGLGIVLKLHDQFSKQAVRVDRQMKMMGNSSDAFVEKMDRGLHDMSAGLGTLAVGAGILGALSFPMREAINFQDAVANTFSIVDENSGITKEIIGDIGMRLGSMFPQDATEMVKALKTTIAAGVDDVTSAEYIVEFATKLAIPTDSNLNDVNSGILSMLQGYNMLDESIYTSEQIRDNVAQTADFMFEASKMARFSDTEVSDLAALAKQLGQITPLAQQLGIGQAELLAIGATGTRTGQNARRMITGLRQSFMDILGAGRGENRWNGIGVSGAPEGGFVGYAKSQGAEMYRDGALDPVSYIRENSFTDFLKLVRGYAKLDGEQVAAALSNEGISEQISTLRENVASGAIKGTADIGAVEGGAELISALQNKIGINNVNRIRDIFPSVWGLTAVLPLIGNQFEFLEKAMARMEKARGSTEKAYKEAMDTVKMQWALLTSQLSTLGVVLGSSLLKPVQVMLEQLNRLTNGLIVLGTELQWLLNPLMTAGAWIGMFLAGFGGWLALMGGAKALSGFLEDNAHQGGILSRVLGGSLSQAIWRVWWLTSGLVAAQLAMNYAWKRDFGGMTTVAQRWAERVSAIFGGVKELFTNLNWATGMSEISESTRVELRRLGVLEFTYKLAAVLYRVGMLMRGFKEGFMETMNAYRILLESFTSGLANSLGVLKILPRVQVWLENLYDPTMDNVIAWRTMGETLGRIGAGLALIVGASYAVTVLANVAGTFVAMAGGMSRISMLLTPFAIGVAGIIAAGYGLRAAWNSDTFGFATYIRENLPAVAREIDEFDDTMLRFRINLSSGGLGYALRNLTEDLTGLLPAEIGRNIRTRLEALAFAIRSFPRTARIHGWSAAARNALEQLFGPEQGQIVYNNLGTLRTGIVERLTGIAGYIRALPAIISALGWREAFNSLYYIAFGESLDASLTRAWNSVSGFITRITRRAAAVVFTWALDNGYVAEFAAGVEAVRTYVEEMKSRWANLRNFFTTVWTDLKTKVNWDEVFGVGTRFMLAFNAASNRVWDELVSAATAAWNSFMTDIDWTAIKVLIEDITGSLAAFGGGEGFDWSRVWRSVAASINIAVQALQAFVDLLQVFAAPPGSDEEMGKWRDLGNTLGGIGDMAAANPLAAFFVGSGLLSLLSSLRTLGHRLFRITGLMRTFKVLGAGLSVILQGLGRVLGTLALRLAAVGFTMLNLTPIGWVITGLTVLIAGAVAAWRTDFMGFRTFTKNTVADIRDAWEGFWDGIAGWADRKGVQISDAFARMVNAIKRAYNSLPGIGPDKELEMTLTSDQIAEASGGTRITRQNVVDAPVGGPQAKILPGEISFPAVSPGPRPAPPPVGTPIFVPGNTAVPGPDYGATNMAELAANLRPGLALPENSVELSIPNRAQRLLGMQPSLNVGDLNALGDADVLSRLTPVMDGAMAAGSPGGSRITAEEDDIIAQTLQGILSELQGGSQTAITVNLDGRQIYKGVAEAQRRDTQRRGN